MTPWPLLRLLSHDTFRSGTELAQLLGVSRASISLALKDAGDLGVPVQSIKGRGYRLGRPLVWLDEAGVARRMGSAARYFDIKLFDEIDSTNSALMAAAQQGAPSGMVYAAERQSAGRGRRGRQWQGEFGGSLMCSLLWRFNLGVADLSGLSLAVGLVVARALDRLGIAGAALKWPNDIVCSEGKLGGILIELSGDALGPSAVVIGIGLNLRLSAALRAGLDQAAFDLAGLGFAGDRNDLLAALLLEFADLLPQFEQGGFAPLRAEWEARHAMQGQAARLLLPNGDVLDGAALGVADDGALRFAAHDGERRVHAGEVSLRRKN
ncbi:biotin--[acetyl-CoA-carboxylase] ligase [Chitinimonas sp.]|uniref:biotin--[acetyl-CoA-carboxylase] ligase n=1 Tax=Chitinimonas sp. TaxID=1934313 RepID=UPI0035AFEFB8